MEADAYSSFNTAGATTRLDPSGKKVILFGFFELKIGLKYDDP
jgi:hypothetical protein